MTSRRTISIVNVVCYKLYRILGCPKLFMASFFRFLRVCMSFVTVGVVHAVVKKIIYSVCEIFSILLMAHESKLKIWTTIKETEGNVSKGLVFSCGNVCHEID